MVDAVGLDATIFLRFTRMCRDLFLAMALVGCAILIPTNMTGGNKALTQGQNKFTLMSPVMVYGKPLWAQVISAWLFNLLVAGFLCYHYRAVRRLRRDYFESSEYQARLHSRTLLVSRRTRSREPPSFQSVVVVSVVVVVVVVVARGWSEADRSPGRRSPIFPNPIGPMKVSFDCPRRFNRPRPCRDPSSDVRSRVCRSSTDDTR